MSRVAFADESGFDSNKKCYSIGVVSFDFDCLAGFETYFKSRLVSHGVQGEGKWTKIRTSHGLINFTLDALYSILRSKSACFDAIVVNTSLYRNWSSRLMTQEDAFYQTYTYLLRHIADRAGQPATIFIDDRTDSYPKRDEMIETIGNHMLSQLASDGRLIGVQRVNSRESVGVQVADLLVGAINAAHYRQLNPSFPLHPAKQLAIKRLSELLGWDDLCYDTMPSDKFNVWHFPKEYRATPKTRWVYPANRVPYVSEIDLIRGIDPTVNSPVVIRKSA